MNWPKKVLLLVVAATVLIVGLTTHFTLAPLKKRNDIIMNFFEVRTTTNNTDASERVVHVDGNHGEVQGAMQANRTIGDSPRLLKVVHRGYNGRSFNVLSHRFFQVNEANGEQNKSKQNDAREAKASFLVKPGSPGKLQWEHKGVPEPWKMFSRNITKDYMYTEDATYMGALLDGLGTVEIESVSIFNKGYGGTQAKLFFTLKDGNTAIGKAMRVSREFVYDVEKPFLRDAERHTAEIAAFHLDRVLNFRRVAPCAGRVINMSSDIIEKSNDMKLLKTFFTNEDGNLCFVGECRKVCGDICGQKQMIEFSLCQYILPGNSRALSDTHSPYSHEGGTMKVWRKQNICKRLLQDAWFKTGRILLDMVEGGILDFFMRNLDRHRYYMLRQFGHASFIAYLDNGKGFGNPTPQADDMTLLAPLYQCCKLRNSTYERFQQLTRKESLLSDLFRQSLSYDLLTPVLTEDHIMSMDRRLRIVIETVDKCIEEHGIENVLVNHF